MVQMFCKLCLQPVAAPKWKSHIAQKQHLQQLPYKIVVKGPFKQEDVHKVFEYFVKFGGIRGQNVTNDNDEVSIEYRFWNARAYSEIIHQEHVLFGDELEISWYKKVKGGFQHVVPDEKMRREKFAYRKLSILNALQNQPTFEDQLTLFKTELKTIKTAMETNRKIIYDDLTTALASTFPHSMIHFFGSSVTDLDIHDSDLNIYVDNTDSELATLELIQHEIEKSRSFTRISLDRGRDTPDVKCEHKDTKVLCQISIRNELPVGISELIRLYLMTDEKLRDLMVLVKFWADCCDLRHAGGFSSYCIYLMVLFFLQQEPYKLPSVADLQKDLPPDEVDGWNCTFGAVEHANTSLEKATILDLMVGFFKFYSNFDYSSKVISPYCGSAIDKICFLKPYSLPECFEDYVNQEKTFIVTSGICIQDVFDHSRNVSLQVDLPCSGRFVAVCRKSLELASLDAKDVLCKLLAINDSLDEFSIRNEDFCDEHEWISLIKNRVLTILTKICNCDVVEKFEDGFVYCCVGDTNIWSNRVEVLKDLSIQFSLDTDAIDSIDKEMAVTSHILKDCPKGTAWKMTVSLKFDSNQHRASIIFKEAENVPHILHIQHFVYVKLLESLNDRVNMSNSSLTVPTSDVKYECYNNLMEGGFAHSEDSYKEGSSKSSIANTGLDASLDRVEGEDREKRELIYTRNGNTDGTKSHNSTETRTTIGRTESESNKSDEHEYQREDVNVVEDQIETENLPVAPHTEEISSFSAANGENTNKHNRQDDFVEEQETPRPPTSDSTKSTLIPDLHTGGNIKEETKVEEKQVEVHLTSFKCEEIELVDPAKVVAGGRAAIMISPAMETTENFDDNLQTWTIIEETITKESPLNKKTEVLQSLQLEEIQIEDEARHPSFNSNTQNRASTSVGFSVETEDCDSILKGTEQGATFTEQVAIFVKNLYARGNKMMEKYKLVVDDLRTLLAPVFPEIAFDFYDMSGTGDNMSKTGLMRLYVDGVDVTSTTVDQMERLFHDSNKFSGVSRLGLFDNLIQGEHVSTHIHFEMNVIDKLPLRTSHLIRSYMSLDRRIASLLTIIKLWNDLSEDKFTNYSICLMTIFYLQLVYKLPGVSKLQVGDIPRELDFSNHDVANLKDADLFELVNGFFLFYDSFDYVTYVISPYFGSLVEKTRLLKPCDLSDCYRQYLDLNVELSVSSSIDIQDHFQLYKNLTADMTPAKLGSFIGRCRLALLSLQNTQSLSFMITPQRPDLSKITHTIDRKVDQDSQKWLQRVKAILERLLKNVMDCTDVTEYKADGVLFAWVCKGERNIFQHRPHAAKRLLLPTNINNIDREVAITRAVNSQFIQSMAPWTLQLEVVLAEDSHAVTLSLKKAPPEPGLEFMQHFLYIHLKKGLDEDLDIKEDSAQDNNCLTTNALALRLQEISSVATQASTIRTACYANKTKYEQNSTAIEDNLRSALNSSFALKTVLFNFHLLSLETLEIYIEIETEDFSDVELLIKIHELLSKSENFTKVFLSSESIRCTHTKTEITCEINISDKFSEARSKLLNYYSALDDNVSLLMHFVKFWADHNNLTGVHGFSSNAIYMMVIFFLQLHFKLPSVEKLQYGTPPNNIDGWNCAFEEQDFKTYKLRNNPIKNLVLQFFDFYGKFDYISLVISPYSGKTIEKVLFLEPHELPSNYHRYVTNNKTLSIDSSICVQDFFNHSKNMSSAYLYLCGKFATLCRISSQLIVESEENFFERYLIDQRSSFSITYDDVTDVKQGIHSAEQIFKNVFACDMVINERTDTTIKYHCGVKYDIWSKRIQCLKSIRRASDAYSREVGVTSDVTRNFLRPSWNNFVLEIKCHSKSIEIRFMMINDFPLISHMCHFLHVNFFKLQTPQNVAEVLQVPQSTPSAAANANSCKENDSQGRNDTPTATETNIVTVSEVEKIVQSNDITTEITADVISSTTVDSNTESKPVASTSALVDSTVKSSANVNPSIVNQLLHKNHPTFAKQVYYLYTLRSSKSALKTTMDKIFVDLISLLKHDRITFYGSALLRVHIPSSDVNIQLFKPPPSIAHQLLSTSSNFADVATSDNRIRCVHASTNQTLTLTTNRRITFTHELLSYYFGLDEKLPVLVTTVKQWMRSCDLSAIDGHVTTLLVVFYLQAEHGLPAVAELQKACTPTSNNQWDVAFGRKAAFDVKASIFRLVEGFFRFYERFDFFSDVVAPFRGTPVAKVGFLRPFAVPEEYRIYAKQRQELVVDAGMCVQCPFEHTRNAAVAVPYSVAATFANLCRYALGRMQRSEMRMLSDLLTCAKQGENAKFYIEPVGLARIKWLDRVKRLTVKILTKVLGGKVLQVTPISSGITRYKCEGPLVALENRVKALKKVLKGLRSDVDFVEQEISVTSHIMRNRVGAKTWQLGVQIGVTNACSSRVSVCFSGPLQITICHFVYTRLLKFLNCEQEQTNTEVSSNEEKGSSGVAKRRNEDSSGDSNAKRSKSSKASVENAAPMKNCDINVSSRSSTEAKDSISSTDKEVASFQLSDAVPKQTNSSQHSSSSLPPSSLGVLSKSSHKASIRTLEVISPTVKIAGDIRDSLPQKQASTNSSQKNGSLIDPGLKVSSVSLNEARDSITIKTIQSCCEVLVESADRSKFSATPAEKQVATECSQKNAADSVSSRSSNEVQDFNACVLKLKSNATDEEVCSELTKRSTVLQKTGKSASSDQKNDLEIANGETEELLSSVTVSTVEDTTSRSLADANNSATPTPQLKDQLESENKSTSDEISSIETPRKSNEQNANLLSASRFEETSNKLNISETKQIKICPGPAETGLSLPLTGTSIAEESAFQVVPTRSVTSAASSDQKLLPDAIRIPTYDPKEAKLSVLRETQDMSGFTAQTSHFCTKLLQDENIFETNRRVIKHDLNSAMGGDLLDKIHFIGASVMGLLSKGGHFDIYINNPQMVGVNQGLYTQRAKLELVKSSLLKSEKFDQIVAFTTERWVKCRHKESNMECLIRIYNDLSVSGSRLIAYYVSLHPKIRQLFFVIKSWSEFSNVKEQTCISTYAIYLMIIFYLQQEPYKVPSIHQLQQNAPPVYVRVWNTAFTPLQFHSQAVEAATVKDLVFGFFRFYESFDYYSHVIAPYHGSALNKVDFLRPFQLPSCYAGLVSLDIQMCVGVGACVQHPFEHTNSITNPDSVTCVGKFAAFCRAALHLDTSVEETLLYRLMEKHKNCSDDDYAVEIEMGEKWDEQNWRPTVRKVLFTILMKILCCDVVQVDKQTFNGHNGNKGERGVVEKTVIRSRGTREVWQNRINMLKSVKPGGSYFDVDVHVSSVIKKDARRTSKFVLTVEILFVRKPMRVRVAVVNKDLLHLIHFFYTRMLMVLVEKNSSPLQIGAVVSRFNAVCEPYKVLVKGKIEYATMFQVHDYFATFGKIMDVKVLGEDQRLAIEYRFADCNAYLRVIQDDHSLSGHKLRIIPLAPLKAPIPNASFKNRTLDAIHSVVRCTSFEQQVDTLCAKVHSYRDKVEKKHELIRNNLTSALSSKFPGVRMSLGPCIAGLNMEDAELEVYVEDLATDELRTLQAMTDSLAESRSFRSAAHVSNLSFITCEHIKTGMRCCLRVGKLKANRVHLLKYYLSLDSKLPKFMVLLKFWAECSDLIGSNGFSDHAFALMALFFLQQRYNLPSVRGLQSGTDELVDGWNCAFGQTHEFVNPSLKAAKTLDLLTGFFKFYGDFDYVTYVISPYFGSQVPKVDFLKPYSLPEGFERFGARGRDLGVHSGVFVQDFFEHCSNVAHAASADFMGSFTNLCRTSLRLTASNEKMLLYRLMTNAPSAIFEYPEFVIDKNNDLGEKEWIKVVQTLTLKILSDVLGYKLLTMPILGIERASFECICQSNVWNGRIRAMKGVEGSGVRGVEREIAVTALVAAEFPEKVAWNLFLDLTFTEDPSSVRVVFRRKAGCVNVYHVCHFVYTRLMEFLGGDDGQRCSSIADVECERADTTKVLESNGTSDKINFDSTEESTDSKSISEEDIQEEDSDGEEDDDIPSDFFDDFANEDFLDGLHIAEASDHESNESPDDHHEEQTTSEDTSNDNKILNEENNPEERPRSRREAVKPRSRSRSRLRDGKHRDRPKRKRRSSSESSERSINRPRKITRIRSKSPCRLRRREGSKSPLRCRRLIAYRNTKNCFTRYRSKYLSPNELKPRRGRSPGIRTRRRSASRDGATIRRACNVTKSRSRSPSPNEPRRRRRSRECRRRRSGSRSSSHSPKRSHKKTSLEEVGKKISDVRPDVSRSPVLHNLPVVDNTVQSIPVSQIPLPVVQYQPPVQVPVLTRNFIGPVAVPMPEPVAPLLPPPLVTPVQATATCSITEGRTTGVCAKLNNDREISFGYYLDTDVKPEAPPSTALARLQEKLKRKYASKDHMTVSTSTGGHVG